MFRAVLIAPDPELRAPIERLVAETRLAVLLKTFDRYLTQEELAGVVRAYSPQVLFVDIATSPGALETAAQMQRTMPGVNVVALHPQCDPQLLIRLLHSGLREILYPPFAAEPFRESMARLAAAIRETPAEREETDLVYTILPAKPGTGASTIALNAALAMSRASEGRVLMSDFDLNCGVTRFQWKLTNPFSVHDAMEKAGDLDGSLWAELVSPVGRLDVLSSGAIQPDFPTDIGRIRRMIDFARRQYRVLLIDLSGNMEHFSIELMAQSRRILLVVRPDLATVYLAREKLRYLRSLDLEDRVGILLNRWHRDAVLSMGDIEGVLGLPVQQTFPEDAKAVYQAVLAGDGVDPASDLGREVAQLAVSLYEYVPQSKNVTPKRRMVEYFSLLPARYSLFPPGR